MSNKTPSEWTEKDEWTLSPDDNDQDRMLAIRLGPNANATDSNIKDTVKKPWSARVGQVWPWMTRKFLAIFGRP